MTFEDLDVEVDGAVGRVFFARPHRRNAYTPQMARSLTSALRELDQREDIRAIVVSGRGEHFGVGADFDVEWRDPAAHGVETISDPASLPWKLRTPIIAAIQGDAIGVSLSWALQFDIRVVSESARLGLPFTRIGVIPDRNSLWSLSRLIGLSQAADLLLTGRTISGAEAHAMGIASRVGQPAAVLDLAMEAATEIAVRCSPAATSATKELLYEFVEEPDRFRAANVERRVLNWVRTLGETPRGIAAARSKQPPEWGSRKHEPIPHELR